MSNIPARDTITQYLANLETEHYNFIFYAPEKEDIKVYYQSPSSPAIPSTQTLELDVDYTVDYNDDENRVNGGYVTLLFVPTNGYILTLSLEVQPTMTVNFSDARNFNGADLDYILTKLLLICQQNLSYNLDRNLSYVINNYLTDRTTASLMTQLPLLAENYVWIGTGTSVTSAEISEVPSASLLRSQLADETPSGDGARLVGYYDTVGSTPTTVRDFLNSLPTYLAHYLITYNGKYAADTGVANTYLAAPSPAYTSYYAGQVIFVLIAHTNTSATCTINVNGLGAKSIKLINGSNPIIGSIILGMVAQLVYDGTNYQLLNAASSPTVTPAIVASAYMNATQVIADANLTLILFNATTFDPYTLFQVSENGFVVPYAGYYQISIALIADRAGDAHPVSDQYIYLYNNSNAVQVLMVAESNGGIFSLNATIIVSAAVNDSFQIFYQSETVSSTTLASDRVHTSQECSNLSIQYLGT